MAFNRVGHTATLLLDGRVLVAGGTSQSGGQPRAAAEVYDPAADTWTAVDDMPEARTDHTAVRVRDGSVIVAGGTALQGEQPVSIVRFDPADGTWAAAGTLESGFRPGRSALLCDGTVLLASGPSVLVYDPEAELVTRSAALPTNHESGTLTTMQDGGALIAGGQDNDGGPSGAADRFAGFP
jgi:hypothetical protein